MTRFAQVDEYIRKISENRSWSLYATEATAPTLNIVVNDAEDRERVKLSLSLFAHYERGENFETFHARGGLLISLVSPEFYREDPKKESM